MSSKALSEKTFGIKNEIWIGKIGETKRKFYLLAAALFFFEIFYRSTEFKNMNEMASGVVLLHSAIFSLSDVIVGSVLFYWFDKKLCFSLKTVFNIMLYSTPIAIVYLFNPYILEEQENAHEVYEVFKYYFWFQTTTVPISLSTSIFATWILWKMRRIELGYVPFEVIYGGEDSVTKKNL